MSHSVVERWFGEEFRQLHPLLQQLHRCGGTLAGEVQVQTGTGFGGWLGRRLAKAIGIPIDRTHRGLVVEIRHTTDALLWNRTFHSGAEMKSIFIPVGSLGEGYWYEKTSALKLWLGVDTTGGAWAWKPLRAYLYGVRLPLSLLPDSRAGKHIEEGHYVFKVEFRLPVFGTVLSYGGKLKPVPA